MNVQGSLKAKWKKYDSYKDSGIQWLSDIPKHWSFGKINYFSLIKTGGTPDRNNPKYWEEGTINWLSSGEVNKKIITEVDNKITEEGYRNSNATILPINSVLIALNGQGKTKGSVALLKVQSTCNQSLAAFICNENILNHKYLFYFLNSKYKDLRGLVGDGQREGLSITLLKTLFTFLPPIGEQQIIAIFLDLETAKLDDIISKKQRLIHLLQEKRQALITRAVTKGLNLDVKMKDSGIEWLGQIPESWKIEPLKYFVKICGGGTPSKDNLDYWNGDIPWVSPKDMKIERISSTEDYITEEGLINSTTSLISQKSVLLVVRSGILRRYLPVAINTVPVSLNQDMKAIIPQKYVSVDYMGWAFKGLSKLILHTCKKDGATVDSIETENLMKLSLPIPISEDQNLICKYLEQATGGIDELIEKLEIQITKIQEYRQALITAAVAGKIDVREEVTA